MASVPNLLNQVIHYVYTWMPKTTKKAVQRKMKVSKKRKKRVNFAQPIKERNSIDCQHLSDLQSSHRPPSTPALSKLVLLHTYPVVAEKQERISPKFSNCDLKVVGISFLSKEKKVSKRSALKKWLHQRENVVRDRNVPFDKSECSHGNERHNLCFEKIFDYSPRFAGKLVHADIPSANISSVFSVN